MRSDQIQTTLTVSVVSHNQSAWLPGLLQQLATTGGGIIAHVVVTHNRPSVPLVIPGQGWPFKLTQWTNPVPLGFGANHNQAFQWTETPFFCVLNPDIQIHDANIWTTLVAAATAQIGCAFPVLLNTDGRVQDSLRSVPTPWALLRRHALGRPDARADWASAAFWVIPSPVYRKLGGFDTRYHLYCEDTDFCLRLQLMGWRLQQTQGVAIHPAQRASRRRWQYLRWHLASLFRLWTQPVMRDYLRLVASRRAHTPE